MIGDTFFITIKLQLVNISYHWICSSSPLLNDNVTISQMQCSVADYRFYTRQQVLLYRVLAIVILSVRSSVCPSVTRVDQSKTVQARITKFSPSLPGRL